MSAHTQGPWEWDGDVCNYDPSNEAPWLVHESEEHDFVTILTGEIKCSNPADARLIAAAPTLLAACLDALDAGNDGDWQSAEKILRAAIAKATGEPQ